MSASHEPNPNDPKLAIASDRVEAEAADGSGDLPSSPTPPPPAVAAKPPAPDPPADPGPAPDRHLLTVDQLTNAKDRREAEVDVPEWGDGAFVKIRSLSTGQWDSLQQQFAGEAMENEFAQAIALCVMGIIEPAVTADQLEARDPAPIVRIAARLGELSGMDGKVVSDAESQFREGG